MMTADEVIDLLTLAAGYDRRTVGEADVEAWGAMALKCGWTFQTARRAIVEHFEVSDRPIMPSNINAILNEVRKRIRARFTEDVCPPRELRDDPRAEIEWRRKRVVDYTEQALDAWARGRPIPELDQRQALDEKQRPQLTAAVSDIAARWSVSRPARSLPPAPRRTTRDRARLERARQELANLRPVLFPDVEADAS